MKRIFLFFSLLALPLLIFIILRVLPFGSDEIFNTSFDEPNIHDRWSDILNPYVSLVEGALCISLPSDGSEKHAFVTHQLPVKRVRGAQLQISGRIRAENVKKAQINNGVKMILDLKTPSGKKRMRSNGVWGTFDWQEIVFFVDVPHNVTEATLLLGMDNTTGTAWFDDISIKVIGKSPKLSEGKPSATIYRGHDLPRLRGAKIHPDSFRPEDLKVLAGDWNANHIRWPLNWDGYPYGPADKATIKQFDAWIDEQCAQLDKMLPELERYGARVALNLSTPPGGRLPQTNSSEMRMFHEKKYQDAFVATWQKIAQKYKDEKAIWSYDLLSDVVEGNMPEIEDLLNWSELALKTSKEIRKIDPDKTIMIQPYSLEWFEPFDPEEVQNVVYRVGMFAPHYFTVQGIYDDSTRLVYPGMMPDGKYWDKKEIRNSLQYVRDFANDYRVAIYVGEFSSIRWAPENSTYRYLRDCIEIFEEEGWDWAYHAFREWDGWSVEHSTDKNDNKRTAYATDREMLLRRWFEKNEK